MKEDARVCCVHACKFARGGGAEGVTKMDFMAECAPRSNGEQQTVPGMCLMGKPGRK